MKMIGCMKLSDEAYQRRTEYNNEYRKKYMKGKSILFNTQYPEDMALLDWLKKQPEGGVQFIKRLIRENMEAAAKNTEQ